MDNPKIISTRTDRAANADILVSDAVTDYRLQCWYWYVKQYRIELFMDMYWYKHHNLYFPLLLAGRPPKFKFTAGYLNNVAIGKNAGAGSSGTIAISNNVFVKNNSIITFGSNP